MYSKYIKRILDIVISLVSLILLCPLFIIISILIKLDSKGPIIFKHKRYGKNGKVFYVLKFRTMIDGADKVGPYYTMPQDNRVTQIGKKLRRLSVDELPQLINILIGDMSLIGPRPPAYKESLDEISLKRLTVKPGITGMAQVNGRSLLESSKRAEYDIYYGENVSFALDIKIILKTIDIVFKGIGVNSSIKNNNS